MNSIKKTAYNTSKLLSLIVFLFAVTNVTQSDTFSDWDKDNDDKLSKSEFQENFSTEHFSGWDTNNDQSLTEEEYYEATFFILDQDYNSELDATETDWGFEHLYGDYVNYDVEVQEGEETATLTYDQYRDSVRDTKFYSESDTDDDSNLTKNELSSSIFQNLDWDDDGSLTRSEFQQFNRYSISSKSDS